MSDSESLTLPELQYATNEVTQNLLPKKIKSRYEKPKKCTFNGALGKGAHNITSESVTGVFCRIKSK